MKICRVELIVGGRSLAERKIQKKYFPDRCSITLWKYQIKTRLECSQKTKPTNTWPTLKLTTSKNWE